jgi:Tfp pilus assembly protein PilW
MFRREDTLSLPDDVRQALDLLCERVAAAGFGPRVAEVSIVDGLAADALPTGTVA